MVTRISTRAANLFVALRRAAAWLDHQDGLSKAFAARILLALLPCLLLAACRTPGPARATITGSVAMRERIQLPTQTEVEVRLADVTDGEHLARVIAQRRFPLPSQLPVPFSLSYDPRQLIHTRRYAVQATLYVDGTARYVTREVNHHILGELIRHAEIFLQPAPAPAPPAQP